MDYPTFQTKWVGKRYLENERQMRDDAAPMHVKACDSRTYRFKVYYQNTYRLLVKDDFVTNVSEG